LTPFFRLDFLLYSGATGVHLFISFTPSNLSSTKILIKINLKKIDYLEKMVLLRFNEFHGLHDEQKIMRKKVNPWSLSYTGQIKPKNGVIVRLGNRHRKF